ncbi:MAG: diacylglycerol/polyprenol kinase family protein [Candidatus Thermoplasmatota archaeon]
MEIPSDLIGVLIVYVYVAIILFVSEKILDKLPFYVSRKFLHIMVGNIAFILPVFQTKEVMAFLAAGPFILFTFLMSPYSPFRSMQDKTSSAGHGMGLVYYSIAWTVLAYLFFEHKEVIAIGILAMSYGDGLASLIGMKYGRKKYMIWDDEKSFVGSLGMFVFTLITSIFALLFYGVSISDKFLIIIYVSFVATFAEGVTPKGLDNLSVPFIAAFLYAVYFII